MVADGLLDADTVKSDLHPLAGALWGLLAWVAADSAAKLLQKKKPNSLWLRQGWSSSRDTSEGRGIVLAVGLAMAQITASSGADTLVWASVAPLLGNKSS